MKILIVGAGAVGVALGVRLNEAGRDVTYLVRRERADALARGGATLTAPDGTHTVDAASITADSIPGPFGLIVVTVKAGAIPTVIDDIAPAVGPDTVIVPFLNGMRHVDLLEERYPGRVAGGLIKIVGTLDENGGAVQMTPMADVVVGSLGADPLPDRIAEVFDVAGLDASSAADAHQILWEKWAFIAAAGIITCLFDNNIGRILDAGGLPFIEAAVAETESVAAAAGFAPSAEAHAQSLAILAEPGSRFTSSLYRDLTAGKPSEAEHILGDLADRARRVDVATPLLDLTLVRVRAAERARAS